MKMSALKKIGFLFVMLGAVTSSQVAFADCGCNGSNDPTVLTADAVYSQRLGSNRHLVFSGIVSLFAQNATLLNDAITAIASQSPAGLAALPVIQGSLALNAQQIAANIASFSPTLPGFQFELATLLTQFNNQVIIYAQTAFGPQDVNFANLLLTAAQIANSIAVGLPAANATTIAGLYNPYIAFLVSQINFFSTGNIAAGLQAELNALEASDNIGAYIAIAELIASGDRFIGFFR